MSRIPPVDPSALTPEQRRVHDEVIAGPRGVVQGPLLVALHQPELADRWQRLGEHLRFGTSLPPRLTEIAILITARRWKCQLEWHLHAGLAEKAGVAHSIIDDIGAGRRPATWDQEDLIVYDYAKELQESGAVSEATYRRALKAFGTVGVVELTALIGYYTMVAMTLNAHELPMPEGATAPFPQAEA